MGDCVGNPDSYRDVKSKLRQKGKKLNSLFNLYVIQLDLLAGEYDISVG